MAGTSRQARPLKRKLSTSLRTASSPISCCISPPRVKVRAPGLDTRRWTARHHRWIPPPLLQCCGGGLATRTGEKDEQMRQTRGCVVSKSRPLRSSPLWCRRGPGRRGTRRLVSQSVGFSLDWFTLHPHPERSKGGSAKPDSRADNDQFIPAFTPSGRNSALLIGHHGPLR